MINNMNTSNVYSQFLDIKKYPSIISPCGTSNGAIASATLGKEKEKDGGNALTKAVASVAITGAIVGFIFSRNGSAFSKKINSWIQRLDDRLYIYRNEKLGFLDEINYKISKGLRKFFEWLGVINNLTAAKDIGFKNFCEKIKLKKPMDWVTNQFKKITMATSRRAYETARNITDNNIAELRTIVHNIEDVKLKETLLGHLKELEKQISGITTATSRNTRLRVIERDTAKIGDEVGKEMKEILSNFRTEYEKLRIYRTEVLASEGKERLVNALKEARRLFTFDISDKVKILKDTCDTIGQAIKFEDKASKDKLREIRKLIKQYAAFSGQKEEKSRNRILPVLQSRIKELKESVFAYGNYSQKTQELFNAQFAEAISVLKNTSQRGTIEKFLGELKEFKASNPKVYAEIRRLTTQMRNATNKAFENELKLYDKFAEYSVGSAPTDAVGILLPLGLGLAAVIKGENKDEKVSATLKAGIPILGGVLTSFVATARMLTNIQGILMGTVAGLVLNALGSKADEAYKQYQEKSLFTQKAIAAYKQNVSSVGKA